MIFLVIELHFLALDQTEAIGLNAHTAVQVKGLAVFRFIIPDFLDGSDLFIGHDVEQAEDLVLAVGLDDIGRNDERGSVGRKDVRAQLRRNGALHEQRVERNAAQECLFSDFLDAGWDVDDGEQRILFEAVFVDARDGARLDDALQLAESQFSCFCKYLTSCPPK